MNKNVYTNSVDPDQTAPIKEQSYQGLHCLSFHQKYFAK